MMHGLALLGLLACGGTPAVEPTVGSAPLPAERAAEPAGSGCVERDLRRETEDAEAYAAGTVMGLRDLEATNCRVDEVDIDFHLGVALPPDAVVDLREQVTYAKGHWLVLRVTRLPPTFDVDLALRTFAITAVPGEGRGEVLAETLDLPVSWPLHPRSPSRDPALDVDWWTWRPGANGSSVRRQYPVPFVCGQMAGGALAFHDGEAMVLHAWKRSVFAPDAACGG